MNNFEKLIHYNFRLKELLVNIYNIEDNMQLSVSDKLSEIKIIRKEIEKIKQDVDTIKREISLVQTNNSN